MSEFFASLPPVVQMLIGIIAVAVTVMIAMAYLTYAERKIMGAMQLRQGPTTVAPFLTFVFALAAWAVIPFDSKLVLANISLFIAT